MIKDQAVGVPKEGLEEPKKKVKIVNFVRKTAQVSVPQREKANDNSSTRKETKKSSEKGTRKNKSVLIKRPPNRRQERNDITSKSAEHSFKSQSHRTEHRSLHSTAYKSIAAGSFTLEPSVPEEVKPLNPPVVLTKKPRREKSIFENDESYEESMRRAMIDEIGPRERIIEEESKQDDGKSTRQKKTSKINPEEMEAIEERKITDTQGVCFE